MESRGGRFTNAIRNGGDGDSTIFDDIECYIRVRIFDIRRKGLK